MHNYHIFIKPNTHWFSIMPNSVCLWRKCYFFLDINFVCSKSRYGGRNLTKKSAKMGWKWHVWETEIRSTIGLILSDVTGCTQRRVVLIVLYCSVLFSDTIDHAENFHFEKNGGKYSRTEFWSGCIRRRWRRGQELFIRQRQWWRKFGRFWPRSWWKSSTPMPMACLSVTAASPTA